MNARTIVFVSCRLFAAYLLITQVLGFLTQTVFFLATGSPQSVEAAAVLAALYILGALILWFGAGFISHRLPGAFAETKNAALNISHWAFFCVSSVGAISIFTGLRFLGGLLQDQLTPNENAVNFAKAYLYLTLYAASLTIFGLIILLFAKTIVQRLSAFQVWASKPLIGEDEP